MPGYQSSSIQTETRTADGQPVTWDVDFEHKTVTPIIAGVKLGTFNCRTTAKDELAKVGIELIEVPAPRAGRRGGRA